MKSFFFSCCVLCCFFLCATGAFAEPVPVETSVRKALESNPNILSATESRVASTHDVRKAQAGYYPTIGVWAGAGVSIADSVNTRAYRQQGTLHGIGSVGLSFSQNLYDGGATDATVKSREASLEASDSLVDDSAITVAYGAISAHVDVIRRREILRMAQDNVREHEKTLGTVQSRLDQGIGSAGEVSQVQSRLARARANLYAHETGLQAALANYQRVVGMPAPEDMQAASMPSLVYASPRQVEEVALLRNPRVLTAQANIRFNQAEKEFAKSGDSPRVSLDVGPTYDTNSLPGRNYNLSVEAQVRVNWNFYQGGSVKAGTEAASARVRKAKADYQSVVDLLAEDIRVSFDRTNRAALEAQEYGKARDASKRARANFYEQFLAGQRGIIDVLDASSEAYSAAVEALVKETDYLLGQYRLLALAGVLLEEYGIDSSAYKYDTTGAPEQAAQGEHAGQIMQP